MGLDTETGLSVLLSALDNITVHMDSETLEAADALIGLREINRIMAELEANNADLGFTKLTNINDLVTIDEGAISALVAVLAYNLWPKYRASVDTPQTIYNAAQKGYQQLYKLGVTVVEMDYPTTLPTGSGNWSEDTTNAFYSVDEE